jgi:hypothetical protein
VLVTVNNSRYPQFLALDISVKLWLMNFIASIAILIPKQKLKDNAKREVNTWNG